MEYSEYKPKSKATLDEIIRDLITAAISGELYYYDYEGVRLYGDKVSLDSAYRQVKGESYIAHLEAQRDPTERTANEIDIITNAFVYIPATRQSQWSEYIRASVTYPYRGKELIYCAQVLRELYGGRMSEAAAILKNITESSDLKNLVLRMSSNLSEYGEQFIDYLRGMRALKTTIPAAGTTHYF